MDTSSEVSTNARVLDVWGRAGFVLTARDLWGVRFAWVLWEDGEEELMRGEELTVCGQDAI